MSFGKSSISVRKSKNDRVYTEKDFNNSNSSDTTGIQWIEGDKYILDVMEQTCINLRKTLSFKHDKKVNSVAFSFNGKYAASGSDDNAIKVYDLKEKINKFILKNSSEVKTIACSKMGSFWLAD